MDIFKKGELKLLWPFYLEYFLASLLFFMPAFLIVYFQDLNLSAFKMGLLLAIWPLSALIFEIPTGAFADLYGRKASVLFGYLIEALVMISLFFFKDYPTMLFLFALLGFGTTFSSGSKDAWIIDSLKNKNMRHTFFSKMQFFINTGLVFSGILGAVLVRYLGIKIMWISAFGSYAVSIFLLFAFTSEKFAKKNNSLRNSFLKLKDQSKQAIKYSYKHDVLFYFIIALMISTFALNFQTNLSWIPLLRNFGMHEYQFGYLWSAIAFIAAMAPVLSIKLLKKGKEKKFIILGTVLFALINILILTVTNLAFALVILLLGNLFYFMKTPSEEVYFHRFMPSRMRATIGSIRNMLLSLAAIIALPLAGLLIDSLGSKNTIAIASILMIPVILLYFKIKE